MKPTLTASGHRFFTANSVRVVVAVVVGVAAPAWSKGGVVAEATAVGAVGTPAVATYGKVTAWAVKGIPFGGCPTPTTEQCRDPNFTDLYCGAKLAARARDGLSTGCDSLCPLPSPADCGSASFWRSVCGAGEETRRLLPADAGCTDGDPSTSCTPHASSCANILRAAQADRQQSFGTIVPNAITKSVIRPASVATTSSDAFDILGLPANGFALPTVTAVVPHLEPTFSGFTNERSSVHYWNRTVNDHVTWLATGNTLPTAIGQRRQAWQGARDAWNANGMAVDDCAETVFEKYYEYSLFEDAIRSPGVDYRDYVNIAFAAAPSPGNPESSPLSAIGTRALAGLTQRQRDRVTPMPAQVALPTTMRRKNDFFVTAASGEPRTEALAEWNASGTIQVGVGDETRDVSVPHPFVVRVVAAGSSDTIGVATVLDFVVVDEDLHARLTNAPMYAGGFGYHQMMRLAIPASDDEYAYALDRVKAEFSQLWLERVHLVERIRKAMTSVGDVPIEVNHIPFDPSIFEQQSVVTDIFDDQQNDVLNLLATQRAFEASRAQGFGVNIDASHLFGGGGGVARSLAGSTSASGAAVVVGAGNSGFGQTLGFLGEIGLRDDSGKLSLETDQKAMGLIDVLDRDIVRLSRLDERIEAELLRARDLACLETATITACDWSPAVFAQEVSDLLVSDREKTYQTCVAATGDDFPAQQINQAVADRFRVDLPNAAQFSTCSNTPYPCVNGAVCTDGPYNASPTVLDRFAPCRDGYHAMVLSALDALLNGAGGIIDPETGDLAPYESVSDSDRMGDSTFGAGYDYSAGWWMDDLPPANSANDTSRWCDVAPRIAASFNVDARVLGAKVDLIEAALETGLGANDVQRATLEIVGVSLISEGPSSGQLDPERFNVIFEEQETRMDEYFSAQATFMVGPVPVTIKGGVTGVLGAVARATAGNTAGGAGCHHGDLGLTGEFVPFYTLGAFASAAVDAVVVAVGVKVSIDIITVAFPFTTSLTLDGLGGNDTRITITNDLDIMLSILGGRMSAFVEVCFIFCEEVEATLWRWAPTKFRTNIFHSNHAFRLGPLVAAQDAIFPIAH